MFSLDDLKEEASAIQASLGVHFKDPKLLFLAFVHSSYVNENKHLASEHNERLEFLGDAVLGLLISDFLYQKYPDLAEGELTLLRSALVGASACTHFVKKLGLDKYILLGKGEKLSLRGRKTILADLFEAIIGAIYLDSGWKIVKAFLFEHLSEEIQKIIENPKSNFKAELQKHTQKHFGLTPFYKVLEETGPGHRRHFIVGVFLDDKELAKGEGENKKEAEQKAAEKALLKKDIEIEES